MTALLQNHFDNYDITIILDEAPRSRAGFGRVAIVADEANGTTLGGSRFKIYTTPQGVTDAFAAGELSAFVSAGVSAALKQAFPPDDIMVIRQDTGAVTPETVEDALTAAEQAGAEFYGVVIEQRTDAEIFLASAAVNNRTKVFACQSKDPAFYLTTPSAGLPTAWAADNIVGHERTLVCWHDDDTEWFDLCYLANRLAFSLDEQSPPWDAPVQNVSNYTTYLDATAKKELDDNFINHGLENGAPFYVDAGVNILGRAFYEITTRDWFETRLRERISAIKADLGRRGIKLEISLKGQGQILAAIEGLFSAGSRGPSPHFLPGQTNVVAKAITQADRDSQKLRFSGSATIAGSARLIDVTLNFSRSLVFSDAA